MSFRPYFKKSFLDLELVYQANESDRTVCLALLDELARRKTARVRKLQRSIQERQAG